MYVLFLKKLGLSRPLFSLFSIQLIVHIHFADDWIRKADIWCRKRPLYQLRHNHFPREFEVNVSFQNVTVNAPSTSCILAWPLHLMLFWARVWALHCFVFQNELFSIVVVAAVVVALSKATNLSLSLSVSFQYILMLKRC